MTLCAGETDHQVPRPSHDIQESRIWNRLPVGEIEERIIIVRDNDTILSKYKTTIQLVVYSFTSVPKRRDALRSDASRPASAEGNRFTDDCLTTAPE